MDLLTDNWRATTAACLHDRAKPAVCKVREGADVGHQLVDGAAEERYQNDWQPCDVSKPGETRG